jgi:membrane protein
LVGAGYGACVIYADLLYRDLVRREGLPSWLRAVLRFGAVLTRKMVRDAVFVRAGTLSYWSLVAMVPALVLSVLLLRALGLESWFSFSTFAGRALAALLPEWDAVGLPAQVDAGKIGVAGLVVAFSASTRIFLSAEEAYNRVFSSRARKPITTRLALYYATLTIAPSITAFGFSITAAAASSHHMERLLPFLVTMAAFTFAIRAIPDAHVRLRSALVGGGVSALGFEFVKGAFAAYIITFKGAGAASLIYGSLAFVPVLLLWVYVVWVIVLVGAEVASVDQRWEDFERAEDRLISGAENRVPDAFFALQVALVIVQRFRRGEGPSPEVAVTHALTCDPDHVAAALQTLEAAGLVARTDRGFVLAGPDDALTGSDLLTRYRQHARPAADEAALGGELANAAFSAPALRRPLADLAAP